jgi:hypothetical protein
VLLHVYLLWPIHFKCSMPMSWTRVQVNEWTQVWEFKMCSLLCGQCQGCSKC